VYVGAEELGRHTRSRPSGKKVGEQSKRLDIGTRREVPFMTHDNPMIGFPLAVGCTDDMRLAQSFSPDDDTKVEEADERLSTQPSLTLAKAGRYVILAFVNGFTPSTSHWRH
jgi:hypothetical protein